MKTMFYKTSDRLRYTLCGSCDKGIEWEYENTNNYSFSMCYCHNQSWSKLTKQFIKRKTRRRKNEPIFTDTESTS